MVTEKKFSDDAENNTAVASADSNKCKTAIKRNVSRLKAVHCTVARRIASAIVEAGLLVSSQTQLIF